MGKSWARAWGCCRKGDPFQGRRVRSCLTLGDELSEETHVLTKQGLYWGGVPGQKTEGWGTPENCSASWLAVL